jgi:hypothetical protein
MVIWQMAATGSSSSVDSHQQPANSTPAPQLSVESALAVLNTVLPARTISHLFRRKQPVRMIDTVLLNIELGNPTHAHVISCSFSAMSRHLIDDSLTDY